MNKKDMNKVRPYKFAVQAVRTVNFKGKEYKILVYGEMNEENHINGFIPVTYCRKSHEIYGIYDEVITNKDFPFRSPIKEFNMGYAICAPDDQWDTAKGISIAKKRFAKSPLKTQNGTFLTKDMCTAIVENEANYLEANISKYICNVN